MTYSVYLSPSAQERNVGVLGYGTEEKRMNQVADVVQMVLGKHGVTVYRNEPEWSLDKIVTDSNSKKPDLHFALHSNAGGGRGCEVYAFSPTSAGASAAKAIYSEIEPLTPATDRGIKFSSALYELSHTSAAAALIEIGFHDNPEDAVWIMNNIEIIGTALAIGVLKYLGLKFDKSKLEAENKPKGVFGVININNVNFRNGPGTKTKVIRRLNKGDKVKLIKRIRVWWLVEIDNEKGYVYDKYITL